MGEKREQRTYSPEVKAAVMAALLEGQSVGKVAGRYEIPDTTVRGWQKKAEEIAKQKLRENSLQKEVGASLDELLLLYVAENLTTLRAQAVFMRNEEWLKLQNASEVAVLHGVVADKTIRLLEIFGQQEED